MRKRALALLLITALLTGLYGCGSVKQSTDNAETVTEEADASLPTEEAEENTADTDYTTGSPWIDSNIESNVKTAKDVDLKDNFDLVVNGDWVKENPIKSGHSSNDYISSFEETLQKRLLEIMQDDTSENQNTKLVHTLYCEFLDWEARDAAGTEPLLPYLQEIEEIQNISDLENYMTGTNYKFSNLLEWDATVNPKNASQKILSIGAPTFFLNDTADYKDLENMSDYTKQTYDSNKEMVETVLLQCGYTQEQVDNIYEGAIQLEKQMAMYCYSNDEWNLTETEGAVNEQVYTPEDLEKYHWFVLLKKLAAAYDLKIIPGVQLYDKMDFFDHLDEILSNDHLEFIKDYLLAHTAQTAMIKGVRQCEHNMNKIQRIVRYV